MTEDRQPKDYDLNDFEGAEDFQQFLTNEYAYLSTWQKILYKLQDAVLFMMVFCFVVGYFAGEHFGVFW